MASFRSFTSSPVLTMPAPSVHQTLFDRPSYASHPPSFGQFSSWSNTPLPNTSLAAGRKRSRDEAAVNLDPPEKLVEPPVIQEAEDEWEYGPGMTLIKRTTKYVADAGSQSGTWVEEKAAEEQARKTEAAHLAQQQLSQQRPSLRSHKSQRLEMTPSLSPVDAQDSRSSPTPNLVNPMASSSDSLAQPVIDDFTLHLGIGWSRVSEDEGIQAAARGWARYIENHYPVTNARIRLESRGLQSYLVEADQGFFLFAENLRQGRLVATHVERAIHNLKTSPPTFDGAHTMEAAETGTPMPSDTHPHSSDSLTQSIPTTHSTDIDMN
ncbi:hypothetical protein NKR19_g7767 [Coniochaeta hoffmannii]|uniref:Uncharacterized protein n=1 Tax=Coniochaeta hoffmannii TaxID=91930 RepID=A0AA38RII0_9PEZI|nr:hypothetical protein NKR19_g7767 [Coniochaeta hoffmannii]